MKDTTFDMTSACIQGGYPQHQLQNPGGACSPFMASQCPSGVQNPTQYMEDRSDSGINSGCEEHASSPGSENSADRFPSPTDLRNSPTKLAYHSTPIFQKATRPHPNVATSGMYPWNSPTSYPAEVKREQDSYDPNLTVSATTREESNTYPLKSLETFEHNMKMTSSSPATSENSTGDDSEHRVTRVNSHGKSKKFPCKQCSFVANSKMEFWKHRKSNHIKPEKLLACHLCPFNTEYKHHFEYHLRNHEGNKPFKCDHCDYSCVNKSMLNSHKKSHSNIYQFRCADCHYVSKYCHSLKLHLRKHGHQPGVVLHPDGSPNPLPVIDVYGSRRGPKVKPINEEKERQDNLIPNVGRPDALQLAALPFQQFMAQAPPIPPSLAVTFFQQAMLYRNLERLTREKFSSNLAESNSANNTTETMEHSASEVSEALDLTIDAKSTSTNSDDEEYLSTESYKYVETVLSEGKSDEEIESPHKETDQTSKQFNCQYCDISFGDEVLHAMHMGYHGYQDPFTCNMCGVKCNDKISFFSHIARTPHLQ